MSKGEPLINTNYPHYDYPSQVDPDEIPDFADPWQRLNPKGGDYAICDFSADETWKLTRMPQGFPEIEFLKDLAEDLKLNKGQSMIEGKKRLRSGWNSWIRSTGANLGSAISYISPDTARHSRLFYLWFYTFCYIWHRSKPKIITANPELTNDIFGGIKSSSLR